MLLKPDFGAKQGAELANVLPWKNKWFRVTGCNGVQPTDRVYMPDCQTAVKTKFEYMQNTSKLAQCLFYAYTFNALYDSH